MSSSDRSARRTSFANRRQILAGIGGFLGVGALSACGFSPAYGPKGGAQVLTHQVLSDAPTNKFAFDLVTQLDARFGRPQNARFGLSYDIKLKRSGVAITTDNATTRYNMTGTVTWALRDLATEKELTKGSVRNFTSYSATGSTIAGFTAELDAQTRLMNILADQIADQLVATASQWSGEARVR